jgi:hypothetical protein
MFYAEYAGHGIVTYDDVEFHLTCHDAPGLEVEGNFPPILSFFILGAGPHYLSNLKK